ncbi:MAG: polyprenyl synthetase family protein [Chloroflexi bacterium]|nr:polyprenyl synthetase family protein [Ktedonobacteraceae bacterium]MBV9019864.1 polyprenyl synthetase family protein [Ktedonobacteraceae bacterium]MBV9707309.1 polyprenyl synthetase family protein [Chloroflexota bacterium]
MSVRVPTTYLFTRYVELLQNALQREVARLRMHFSSLAIPELDSFYGQLGYHLGWLDAHFVPVQHNTGKLLRPTLLLLAYEAAGACETTSKREEKTHLDRALPAAVAIELLHNFTLIHDDIEDGDRERRSRPTAWAVFGIPQAINLGDGLASLSRLALFTLLDKGVDADLVARLGYCFDRATLTVIEGQHMDICFETQEQVTVPHYLEMITRKTAALLACAAEMGARLGCSDEPTIKALHQFGWHLGTAFQVRDDLLGIWATQAESGKTPAGDVFRRKKTLPVLHAIQHASPQDHAWLRTFYSQQEAPRSEQVGQVLSILEHTRSREYCQHFLTEHCLLARDALRWVPTPDVPLAQEAIADLGALIEYVSQELWPMKAGDRAAVQEQALPLNAELDCREKDDR